MVLSDLDQAIVPGLNKCKTRWRTHTVIQIISYPFVYRRWWHSHRPRVVNLNFIFSNDRIYLTQLDFATKSPKRESQEDPLDWHRWQQPWQNCWFTNWRHAFFPFLMMCGFAIVLLIILIDLTACKQLGQIDYLKQWCVWQTICCDT